VARFDETGAPTRRHRVLQHHRRLRRSALASGRDVTGDDGVAAMAITAGIEQVSFRVTASSQGTDDLVFDVSVSRYPFVDVRCAHLPGVAWPVTQVRAIIFETPSCSGIRCVRWSLSRATPWPDELRPEPTATLEFVALPARSYAVVGRARTASGT